LGTRTTPFTAIFLREHCAKAGVEIRAWVLMPNHVHLILNPSDLVYLELALAGRPPLATLDRKLAAAARGEGLVVLRPLEA